MVEFSFRTRKKDIQNLDGAHFEVLVVGGGIIGAGIANKLAQQGTKVLLVDKGDFASGTSSASSKLIHGGLRYLAQGKLGLTRALLRERNWLLENTDIVKRKDFDVIIADGMFGRLEIAFGLALYKLLGGGKHSRFIRNEGRYPPFVKGYFTYLDATTDDALLTVYNIVSARKSGAKCLNYVKLESSSSKSDRTNVILEDMVDGGKIKITTRMIVNCAGSWLTQLSGLPKEDLDLVRLSKGIHLIFPRNSFPGENAAVFRSPIDRRQMFIIPRENSVIVGTTDDFVKDPNDFVVRAQEREYVLKSVESFTPDFSERLMIGEYAGIRTMYGAGNDPGKVSRDFTVKAIGDLYTVIGGKVTDYRRVAGKVSKMVQEKIGKRSTADGPAIGYRRSGDPITSSIQEECAMCLDDIVKRRLGTAFFDPSNIVSKTEEIMERLQAMGISIDDRGFFKKA